MDLTAQVEQRRQLEAALQGKQEELERLQVEFGHLQEVTADQEAASAAEQELRTRVSLPAFLNLNEVGGWTYACRMWHTGASSDLPGGVMALICIAQLCLLAVSNSPSFPHM